MGRYEPYCKNVCLYVHIKLLLIPTMRITEVYLKQTDYAVVESKESLWRHSPKRLFVSLTWFEKQTHEGNPKMF
jgi:hypothetical protein